MDLDAWISELRACRTLPERQAKQLCAAAVELLVEEGNVAQVSAPVTICGDIHGQFYDLGELFVTGGDAPRTSYLFLGGLCRPRLLLGRDLPAAAGAQGAVP
jgi:hypothetical protein